MSRYDQCDDTCTTDCGHCKGAGAPVSAAGDRGDDTARCTCLSAYAHRFSGGWGCPAGTPVPEPAAARPTANAWSWGGTDLTPPRRTHTSAERPKVTADVLVAWGADADPADVEESIKQAARAAVLRYRDEAGVRR